MDDKLAKHLLENNVLDRILKSENDISLLQKLSILAADEPETFAENGLTNGGFDFAQRQTPGTLTTIADLGYGPDRWKMTRENADLQFRRVDASAEPGLTSPYYGEFKKITNAGKLLICQPIEYLETLKYRGNTISFQLQMKASSAKTIKIAIVELQAAGVANTLPTLVSAWGADGTDPTLGANLAVISSPISCSVITTMQVFQFSAAFPATSKNLLVMIWSDADFAVNDTLSLAEAGLYFGDQLRLWAPRPYQVELVLCRRRYRKSYPVDTAPGTAAIFGYVNGLASSTSVLRAYVPLDEMAADPTATLYSIGGTVNKVSTTASADIGTSVTVSVKTSAAFSAFTDSGAGFTAAVFYIFHFTASAEL